MYTFKKQSDGRYAIDSDGTTVDKDMDKVGIFITYHEESNRFSLIFGRPELTKAKYEVLSKAAKDLDDMQMLGELSYVEGQFDVDALNDLMVDSSNANLVSQFFERHGIDNPFQEKMNSFSTPTKKAGSALSL